MSGLPLDRLLDDASQFPPGNLALEPAWQAHRRWRQSSRADVVGRFLVPSARMASLAELVGRDGADGIELGIVVGGKDADGGLGSWVGSVELRGSVDDVGAWRERFSEATVFVEGAPVSTVAELRERDPRVGAKLRCGGLEAPAFPSIEVVAAFVSECVRLDVPFKATAGLHQPLRYWDPEIQVFHHGFLNLWAATALAAHGAEAGELAAALSITDAESWRGLGISAAELKDARGWFTAFGTCSIDEPLEALGAIGLLDD